MLHAEADDRSGAMMGSGVVGDVKFEAPGPGSWELDATHRGRRPVSPFTRELLTREAEAGSVDLLAKYGLPLERIRTQLVEGCLYLRPTGVGEGPVPKAPPPVWIMKIGARLHPEMRRRNRAAAQAWRERRWRTEVDDWFDRDRAAVVARNLALHRVDLSALDDHQLVAQVTERLQHFGTQARESFQAHGADLIPTGDFLAHCRRWGIADADAAALLQGSSPASIETAELLAPVARAIGAAGAPPKSIDEVRALGPEVAGAVDSWLELHGWRLVTSDDIDKPTLAERPNLQLAALLAAADPETTLRATPDAGPLRSVVPAGERAQFDSLLAEARYGMRQRDDSAGVRWNWSGGLLRRALLEVGRRLADDGRLEEAHQVVELRPDELGPLLLHHTGPSAREIAARAERRDLIEAAHAPDTLGDPEPAPPIDALPAAMARATTALMTVMEAEGLAATPGPGGLHGTGIGSTSYRGVARVATSADDALDRLEPGDVLIAPFTGPSYNSILPILGGLVVDAGGPMCHAAIVAREFQLPALIGVCGASAQVPDGALVELDPSTGTLRIID
jgi:phosphohistidine swiveling domain-containing protein